MPRRPKNDPHFTWQEGDVTFVLPQQLTTVLNDELHTILWTLEQTMTVHDLSQVIPNAADYLEDHPQDTTLVNEGIKRAEARLTGAA